MKLHNNKFMKSWHIWVSIAAVLVLGFLFSRDSLARVAWQKYGMAQVALALNRHDAGLATRIGNHFFNADKEGAYDLALAKRHYTRALEIDAKALEPLYQLARIDFLRGDCASALKKADRIAADYPDFKRLHYLRGLIHGYAGNLEKAETDFLAFLEWDPKSWAAHNDLAWIYFRQGDYQKVKEAAKAGLQWNPDNAWLLTSYGVALLNTGERKEAGSVLARSLIAAQKLTSKDWQKAYPGNHPSIADQGLASLMATIRTNLSLTVDKP